MTQPQQHAPAHARNENVDSLRFLAMTAVVAQHCDLVPFGWVGVWLFFVISGFVVTSSVLDKPSAAPLGQQLKGFYLRRVARIFPAYFVFLGVAALVGVLGQLFVPTSEWLALIGFYYNFYSVDHNVWVPAFPTSHLWSISVEMQFYAVMGILLFTLDRTRLAALLVAMALFSGCARLLGSALYYTLDINSSIAKIQYYVTINQMDAFCVGALLALYRHKLTRRTMERLFLIGVGLLTVYVAFYMGVNAVDGRRGLAITKSIITGDATGHFREAVVFVPLIVLSAGLVGMAYTGGGRVFDSVLSWKWVRRAGRTSYSGYLWHFAVIVLVKHVLESATGLSMDARFSSWPNKLMMMIIVMPIAVAVAELSYRCIEIPGAKLFNRLGAKARNAPVETAKSISI